MDLTGCLLLIGIGLLLMPADMMLPTGGVLFALGLAAVAIGTVWCFALGLVTGLLILLGEVIFFPVLFLFIGYLAPFSPLAGRFGLANSKAQETVSELPTQNRLEHLRGRIGRTLSPLRPAGAVDFDGLRVDTLSEGMMIEPGQYVRCIDVRAGKVIVREIVQPDPDVEIPDLKNLNDFDLR